MILWPCSSCGGVRLCAHREAAIVDHYVKRAALVGRDAAMAEIGALPSELGRREFDSQVMAGVGINYDAQGHKLHIVRRRAA